MNSWMRRTRLLIALSALVGVACVGSSAEPAGQYGAYHARNKLLYLPTGDTITVYRIKRWDFGDGSLPALQLEYASPGPVSDTIAVKRLTERIWPAFEPYVEGRGLRVGIITATNLEKVGQPGAWITRTNHQGFIARRDSTGIWRVDESGEPLPPPPATGKARLVEADGSLVPYAPQ